MRRSRLSHVPKFVFEIIYFVFSLNFLLKLLNNLSKEHINDESVDRALMVHIKDSPEVLKGLRRFFIFHGQNEI